MNKQFCVYNIELASLNELKVNRGKSQLIGFDRQSTEHSLTFNVGESVVENQPVVKLLGLYMLLISSILMSILMIYVIRHKGKLNVLARQSLN